MLVPRASFAFLPEFPVLHLVFTWFSIRMFCMSLGFFFILQPVV